MAPTNLDDCDYLATDTRTPYNASFDGSQGGQGAHFIGVWVNGKDECGQMSQSVSEIVPG